MIDQNLDGGDFTLSAGLQDSRLTTAILPACIGASAPKNVDNAIVSTATAFSSRGFPRRT